MNKRTNQKGATLVEGVIAMLVLCIVIIALLMMAWVIIQGKNKPKQNYDTAFTLNTLRDALSAEINTLDDPDIAIIHKIANDYIVQNERYKGWKVQNVTLKDEICRFDLVQTIDGKDSYYEVKLYVPTQ